MIILNNVPCCVTLFTYPTILIIDSGVGGLFVYQNLRRFLPCVCYLYFFDSEAFPYGERSSRFIFDRVFKIFKKVSQYHRVDLAILACNTVTVLSLEKLRSYFFFPIIGVMPNISLGLQYTRSGIIGLLATYRTVNSELILNIIKRFSLSYKFLLFNASKLVSVSEDKILYRKRVPISLLRNVLSPWLNVVKRPDTIILGCTHFLHLENEFRMVFPNQVHLVGISENLAYRVVWLLSKNGVSINRSIYLYCKIKNRAYCSMTTKEVLSSWSLLLRDYSFSSLRKISI